MATPLDQILQWFLQGKKPTQSQFEATFRSFWHKEETIPANKIEGFNLELDQMVTKTQFAEHLTDAQAHVALLVSRENNGNKQNSLDPDTTGTKFPTVDAVNGAIGAITNALDAINGQII